MKESINDLRIRCQHSYYGWHEQPWLFLQIRKVSIYVTWVLLRTPFSPNTISVLAIGTGVLASVALAMGQLIPGLILIQLAIILDFSDGEVSRYRNQRSKEGSYLDKVYIFLVHPCLFAGITLLEFRVSNQFSILVAGFANVICVFVFCMVIEYGRQIAVWKHFMKFISGLNSISGVSVENITPTASIAADSNPEEAVTLLRKIYTRTLNWLHRARVNDLLKLWDFPYVFVVMSLAILAEILIQSQPWMAFSASPISLYLYFYAISYPGIIVYFLARNVLFKVIESDYQVLTRDFMSMLDKRCKTR